MSTSMPALYLSHGAPPLLDDSLWVAELKAWRERLPVPEAILIISAHWESRPISLSSSGKAPLVYDFWGFEDRFYELQYPASGSATLAGAVDRLLHQAKLSVDHDEGRGLDHGAWVPLMVMYPEATIPVMQLSLPTLDPRELFQLGAMLAPLRDEGVMIIGSGFFTHNLRALRWELGSSTEPPSWSREFDEWGAEALAAGEIDTLLDFARLAPAPTLAHPRTEHFAPLFVTLGAGGTDQIISEIEGFWYGLAKRSLSVGVQTD
ncbi:MAG: dioxygenase [Ferrimicrobium sp.]|jgi:4,5-DOPA dioxygenase extradiol|nr:dioxygenase [Ferrimicrobium sp.]